MDDLNLSMDDINLSMDHVNYSMHPVTKQHPVITIVILPH